MTHDEQWDEIESRLKAKVELERARTALLAIGRECMSKDGTVFDIFHPEYTNDVAAQVSQSLRCNAAYQRMRRAREAGENPILWKLANG